MNFKNVFPLNSEHLRIADKILVTESVRYSEVSLHILSQLGVFSYKTNKSACHYSNVDVLRLKCQQIHQF